MAARVPPDELVKALVGPQTTARGYGPSPESEAADARGCTFAQNVFYGEARSLSVWTVFTWVLGAATVAFLLLIFWLLASVLLESADAFTQVAKLAAAAGVAVATLVTGSAVSFVFDRRKDQLAAVATALNTVNDMCGGPTAQKAQQEAEAVQYKPLPRS